MKIFLCLIVTLVAFAQTGDIFQRLRRVLAASGQGDLAAGALAKKDFSRVEGILATVRPTTQTEQGELLSLQGAVQFLDGKMAASVATFSQAAKLQPLADSDSFTLAMALVKLGDDTRARSVLASLSEKHPDHAIYLYWLGRLDYDQRRYQEAVEKLRKAAELDPNSPRILDSLGLAFDMQGRMEPARAAFEKAVNLNRAQAHPSPWPPHNLGFLLLRMDQFKDAETALRESLRYDPKLAQAHAHLARVLEKQGRDNEAIGEYSDAVSLDPASPDACYSLGMLYRKLHRGAEAQAMFSEFKKRKQGLSATPVAPLQGAPQALVVGPRSRNSSYALKHSSVHSRPGSLRSEDVSYTLR